MSTPIKREDIRKGDLIRREGKDGYNRPISLEYWAHSDGRPFGGVGYTYYLLKRNPPVEFPTVSGYYESSVYPLAQGFQAYRLFTGQWFEGDTPIPRWKLEALAPLTRLRSEAETATEVIDYIESGFSYSSLSVLEVCDKAREKFGVAK